MKRQSKAGNIVQTGLFAGMIAVCSWISIPSAVPFTLQTLGVFTAIGVLGGKKGTLSILTYILLGIVGLPVFAGFAGGIGVLFGATGGYILGFLFSALFMWGMETLFGNRKIALGMAMIGGLLICYCFGTVWFMAVYMRNTGAIGVGAVLLRCVIPFIIPDLLKIAAALWITNRLKRAGLC